MTLSNPSSYLPSMISQTAKHNRPTIVEKDDLRGWSYCFDKRKSKVANQIIVDISVLLITSSRLAEGVQDDSKK